jgi:hypothetical protein
MSDVPVHSHEAMREHVSEIMFDPSSSPEHDCTLCQQAVVAGIWREYGVEDPFAPIEDDCS